MADLNEALGGLIPGDNIVWVAHGESAVSLFEDAFMAEGLRRGRTVYVRTDASGRGKARLDPAVTVLDARPGHPCADASALEEALVDIGRTHHGAYILVDGLDTLVRRWGPDRVVAFYSRACPRLFGLGALAYWRVSRDVMRSSSLAQIRHVAQCVLEVGPKELSIAKAEGRPAAVQGRMMQITIHEDLVSLTSERALGRLGRGLQVLRRQRNLTQADLARLAGVTPSAISQAEAGRRGLSLDTLLFLSEQLGIGLDELLENRPETGYVLARRSATSDSVIALFNDPDPGLRAFLVRLEPGKSGTPPFSSKGIELVVVAAGLVQLTVGPETPVMRAGDAVLATRSAIRGWRNLVTEPALLFWILKD